MMYLDLTEIDLVLARSWFWSTGRWAIARFVRNDFFGDSQKTLDASIRDYVESNTNIRPLGPIRMLANLRYFGYITNPLTTYYCFDASGERLEAIVAQVNNTPWGESHAYVLPVNSALNFRCEFDKKLHVSPFNPLTMRYRWSSNLPGEHLSIHLENWQLISARGNPTAQNGEVIGASTLASKPMSGLEGLDNKGLNYEKVLDATMTLHALPITQRNLNSMLIAYPFMTVKVIAAIYWQALRLALKRTPFFSHPSNKFDKNKAVYKI
jgi:DUF1365 family protein